MERNPKTGRFLPGNQVSVGNAGNKKPKWGNKNAVTHGFHSTFNMFRVLEDGCLCIYLSRENAVRVKPDQFMLFEDGSIAIHDDTAFQLERLGVKLEQRISE